MKRTAFFLAGALITFLVVMTGCRKDLNEIKPDPAPQKVESMYQLQVTDDFSWKTIQDVQVNFTVSEVSTLIIKSASGAVYHKALMHPGESYATKITLPTYEKEVTVVVNGYAQVLNIEGQSLVKSF
jgi:hypothetical protein